MRRLRATAMVLLALGCPVGLSAQPGLDKKTADSAWEQTVALAAPVARSGAGPEAGPATATHVIAAVRDYAAQQKAAAQSAKDFQVQHPTDARVPAAKKLEATSALRSVWPLPPDRGQAAFQTAASFVADLAHAPKDRFEVAALLAEQQHKIQAKGRPLARDSAAHEQAADALHAEFGDIPESFAFYLGVADVADVETSRRAASKIVQSAAAPEARKQQARVVLARYAQLGKPVTLNLTEETTGQRLNGTKRGKVTVVYVWSASHGVAAEWGELARVKKELPSDVDWIYVALDSSTADVRGAAAKAPFAGTHCLADARQRVALAKDLKFRRVPYAYVVDRIGKLSGYGGAADLPALVTAAQR